MSTPDDLKDYHKALDHLSSGQAATPRVFSDITFYVHQLAKENKALRHQVAVDSKSTFALEQALATQRELVQQHQKQFELDSKRIAALSEEKQELRGQLEHHKRALKASREHLSRTQHNLDRTVELIRGWAETIPRCAWDDDPDSVYSQRDALLDELGE